MSRFGFSVSLTNTQTVTENKEKPRVAWGLGRESAGRRIIMRQSRSRLPSCENYPNLRDPLLPIYTTEQETKNLRGER